MATKSRKMDNVNVSIWERDEPTIRPAPSPLSRRAIVAAAIRIADEEGLDAVSLRKVGAALNSGPMRLYGYVATKAELLDLMVDDVYTEMMATGSFEGGWRNALSGIALRLRLAVQRHGWFIELFGSRPHQGPGALAFLEAAHAGLNGTPGFENIDQTMKAVRATCAYALGAIRIEVGEARAERESGMTKAQWQFANSGYLLRMIGKGEFPTLARIMREHTDIPASAHFDEGLECMLDGIAANVGCGADQRR